MQQHMKPVNERLPYKLNTFRVKCVGTHWLNWTALYIQLLSYIIATMQSNCGSQLIVPIKLPSVCIVARHRQTALCRRGAARDGVTKPMASEAILSSQLCRPAVTSGVRVVRKSVNNTLNELHNILIYRHYNFFTIFLCCLIN